MNFAIQHVFKFSLTSAALLLAIVEPALAWTSNDNTLELGTSIQYLNFNSSNVGYTGNPALNNDAWGMQGAFTSFYLPSLAGSVTVEAKSSASNYPGFTIYRTDGQYEGATVGPDATVLASNGAIHDFNQVGQAGDPGIVWATNTAPGQGGIVETLGYVNSSSQSYTNNFGGVILSGAHDVSVDNLYETGIIGSVTTTGNPAFATSKRIDILTLSNLAAGWYSLFVGGSDIKGSSAGISLTVSAVAPVPAAVPVPGAVWLFGSALVGFMGATRKKLRV